MTNNSKIASNWPGFRKIWMILAILLFLLLLLLWLLGYGPIGYGPNGSKCEVAPTVVEKIVEKDKLVDNPVLLTQITNLKKEKEAKEGTISELKTKLAELEAQPSKAVVKEVDNPELVNRIKALEKENSEIAGLKAKLAELEAQPSKTVVKEVDNPELVNRIKALEKENSEIAELKAKIAELQSSQSAKPVMLTEEVESPELLNKIRTLETENKLIPSLRARIRELEQAKPEVKVTPTPSANLPDTAKLYFRISSATAPVDTRSTLSSIINYLKNNEGSKALVSGFHDATGNLALNQKLSLQRAESVVVELKRAGIPANQIIVTKPTQTVGSGTRNEARRVEVKIMR